MQLTSAHPPQIPFHFFPKSTSPPSHVPSVVVKTRVVTVPQQATRSASTPRQVDNLHQRNPSQVAPSTNVFTTHPATKRYLPYAHSQRRAKRARSSDSSDATPPPPSRTRESSIASSASSSRASTRNRSSPPTSVASSIRSRSRSSSVLPIFDDPIPRECHIDEDAVLDDTFLSSEKVVLRLMKSYVQYFKNPNDPHDKSFDPHPTDYPVGELEFPNSGATERYVFVFSVAHVRPWRLAKSSVSFSWGYGSLPFATLAACILRSRGMPLGPQQSSDDSCLPLRPRFLSGFQGERLLAT
ncbi:hypothetical protein BJV78DRAFT_863147 [Lactifluus subvellereus]|nr:hypothetical protein BJV78DRAFT_863147 [Lactifluus subvellereus]